MTTYIKFITLYKYLNGVLYIDIIILFKYNLRGLTKIMRVIFMKKRFAFTLAEVLITLGIIGVVAALTIPGLITKNKAKRLKSQYMKAYSEIAQAIKMMKYDEISLDTITYSGNKQAFKNVFREYFKVLDWCEKSKKLCYDANSNQKLYKSLDGGSYAPATIFDDGQIVLMDGANVLIENPYGTNNAKIWIHVDVNGKNGNPNRLGYDVFTFVILNEELVPMGAIGTQFTDMKHYCNPKGNGQYNGIACAYQAMNENDYFDKIVQTVK